MRGGSRRPGVRGNSNVPTFPDYILSKAGKSLRITLKPFEIVGLDALPSS
jgi:hypothetical protein